MTAAAIATLILLTRFPYRLFVAGIDTIFHLGNFALDYNDKNNHPVVISADLRAGSLLSCMSILIGRP